MFSNNGYCQLLMLCCHCLHCVSPFHKNLRSHILMPSPYLPAFITQASLKYLQEPATCYYFRPSNRTQGRCVNTKLHEWRVYLQRWFLGFKDMRSMRTLRQKRRSSTKLGSKNCVTIFGAEFGSAAAEYGPIRKKLWRQPSSFKQYFQTKLCSKKMWQNWRRFYRDVGPLVVPFVPWCCYQSQRPRSNVPAPATTSHQMNI